MFRKSAVRVLFVDNAGTPGTAAAGLFEFSPSIDGTAEWANPRELVFKPKGELKPGQEYRAVLRVGKILDLPKAYARFEFRFGVVRPDMEVTIEGLFAEDPERPQAQVLRGRVVTADMEEKALVEKVLEAEQDGRTLPVEWSHAQEGLTHYFRCQGRRPQGGGLGGQPVVGRRPDPHRQPGPPRRRGPGPGGLRRRLHRARPGRDAARPGALLRRPGQGPEAPGAHRHRRPPADLRDRRQRRPGVFDPGVPRHVAVSVQPGVRNYLDRRLKDGTDRTVTFESIRPQVRFVGRGLILPRKDRLTVPIEAVNLRSVQVAAFQIYPGNMAQFFQVNSLEGSEELARVGRYLWRKTVPLSDDPAVTGRVTRFDLDVTPLFKENPGSLFRLVLSFNRGNSTYPCAASDAPVVTEPPLKNMDDAGYGRYSNWDYMTRAMPTTPATGPAANDPCADAYYIPRYNHEAVAGRNFFSSDIGLVAKLEENGSLHVVTTDIGTARPLSGLRVRAYNYQNQLLGETTSDANGFAVFALKDRAFYVSAEGGGDIGYLRIAGEGALPLSHFDIGGEVAEKGVKGILYGERGVWRPGDTLHLTFALFDRQKVLPAGHPVLLEISNPQGQLVMTAKPDKVVAPFYAFRVETDEAAPDGQLAGPRPRRRPDLQQDPQDRDGRAQPAQDRPRRRARGPRPQGHALRRGRHVAMAPRRAGLEPEVRRLRPALPPADPLRQVPGLQLRRPGPRLRRRDGRGGQGRPRRRGPRDRPDRHRPAAAQPGDARRGVHQPGLRGKRRFQRRHVLASVPSL